MLSEYSGSSPLLSHAAAERQFHDGVHGHTGGELEVSVKGFVGELLVNDITFDYNNAYQLVKDYTTGKEMTSEKNIYGYDVDGNRRTVDRVAGPVTTQYLYDGDNVTADINATTGDVVRTYVTPMLDSNVSMTVHGATPTTYYYNQDERSSVVNLTDSTGVVGASYAYSAYGDPVSSLTQHSIPDTQGNRYTYTGRESSEVSGDYYFRYRWYGTGIGFNARDRLHYTDGMSLYMAWFATRLGIDPHGLVARSVVLDQLKATCENRVKKLFEKDRRGKYTNLTMRSMIEKAKIPRNCAPPGPKDINCICCEDNFGYYRHPHRGEKKKIDICYNRIAIRIGIAANHRRDPWVKLNEYPKWIDQVVIHETVHWLDFCRVKLGGHEEMGAKARICTEIRAYTRAGECRWGGTSTTLFREPDTKRCMRKSVRGSVGFIKDERVFNQLFDQLYDKCRKQVPGTPLPAN